MAIVALRARPRPGLRRSTAPSRRCRWSWRPA
jgi:hypothetical protein